MLLLLLRWFGMVLTLVFALIFISSYDRGELTERGQPEKEFVSVRQVGKVAINWPVALPIGLGLSAGITCVIASVRWEEKRSRSQRNRCQTVEKGITEPAQ
jgi:hypothetical protein